MFADELAVYLETQGLGVYANQAGRSIFTYNEPPESESGVDVLTVVPTGGRPPQHVYGGSGRAVLEEPIAQVRVRCADAAAGWARITSAYQACNVRNALVGGVSYLRLVPLSAPRELPEDANERTILAFDAVALKVPS